VRKALVTATIFLQTEMDFNRLPVNKKLIPQKALQFLVNPEDFK
jgi:hypothetical protein